MKRFLAFLLLSACSAEPPPPEEAEQNMAAQAAADALPDAVAERDLLQSAAAAAVGPLLQDSASAQYVGLWRGNEGAICGGVDSAQAGGRRSGVLPFVVTPAGLATVNKGQDLSFDDPKDKFVALYLRWCASPEEASLLTDPPELEETPPPAEPVTTPDEEIAPPPTPPPAPPAPAQPVPSRRGGDGDSFSDAVLRPIPPEKK